MNTHAKWIWVIVLALAMSCCLSNEASALGVSPGAFCAQGVPVGEKIDTGTDLKVTNDTDKERTFTVKVGGIPAMKAPDLRGYATMPDLSWFILDKTELTAPAKGSAAARMSVEIPNDDRYYNQHWGVSCLIEYTGQKGLFQEAIKTVYMFETKSKEDIKGRPLGNLGVAPSIVSIDIADKKASPGKFSIYNNTAETAEYKLTTRIAETKGDGLKLNASPGFTWLPKAVMVKVKKATVKVKAGETASVTVSENVPNSLLTDGCKLEGAVFIESDKGDVNFVRVHIEKIPAPKPEEPQKEASK
jgi:hypothetical protein